MNIFSLIHTNSYVSYAVQMGFALIVLLIFRWHLAKKRKHTPEPGALTPIEKAVHTLLLSLAITTAIMLFLSILSLMTPGK